jgi:hypothetical protein
MNDGSELPLEARARSVYTYAHGPTASDRPNASQGAHRSVHRRRAAGLAEAGGVLWPDGFGSRAPLARHRDLNRIAVAIERLVGVHERVASALERVVEGSGIPAGEEKGASAMRETTAAVEPSQAEYVTQKTSLHVLGLPPRQFLELLRRQDAPPVSVMGKLRMVRRDAMLAYVGRLGAKVRGEDAEQKSDGADAVLREIGCAPVRR